VKACFSVLNAFFTIFVEIPRSVFSCKMSEWDDYVGIVEDETSVEVGESQEGLNVFYFLWFRPLLNCFHFSVGHGQTRWR